VLRPASIRQWAPRYRGVRSLSRFAPRGLYLLGGVALAGLLVFAYTGVSWRYQLWSDHASTVLAGLDMLRGNWNLEGWSLATHSLWSTEIPVYALALFVRGFFAVVGSPAFLPCGAGFLAGYLLYDMLHYHVHHHRPRTALGKRLRELHMRHHFQNHDRGYGVSAPFWDHVFGTAPGSDPQAQ